MMSQCPAECPEAVGSDRCQSQGFWGLRYGQEWWLWAGRGWAFLEDSGGSYRQQLPCPNPRSQRGAQRGRREVMGPFEKVEGPRRGPWSQLSVCPQLAAP